MLLFSIEHSTNQTPPQAEGEMALSELKLFMEANGRRQTDLAKVIKSRARASEILNGKRAIGKTVALRIYDAWGVPLEDLLR
jgi:HTH-type transcriptional regulator/antitoxin HigA